MAMDDEKRDDPEELWSEIDGVDLPELAADVSLPPDDEEPVPSAAAGSESNGPEASSAAAEPGAAGDSDIDAWLNDFGDEPRPALSVFQEEESGAFAEEGDHALIDRSAVEIGTGQSGVATPSSLEAGSDPFGDLRSGLDPDESPDFSMFVEAENGPAVEEGASDAGEGVDWTAAEATDAAFAFEDVVEPKAASGPAGHAAATGATPLPEEVSTAAGPRKKSGLGGLIGIVAGGLLAIPLTLGILLWGLGRDPFGLANLLPQSLGFLVPAELRPAGFEPPVAMTVAEPLRQLDGPAAAEPVLVDAAVVPDEASAAAVGGSDAEPLADVADATGMADGGTDEALTALEPAEPPAAAAVAGLDAVMDDAAIVEPDPLGTVPVIEPDPAALLAILEPRDAGVPVASEQPPAMEPEPEPLDVSELVTTAADAVAATEAVALAGESAAPSSRQLVDWYRALATYAESLARLEREAVESGRSLDEASASVADVTDGIGSRPEIHALLARLSRDWIGYARRPSDGVVIPARFLGARPVGPFWRSEVRIGDTEGRPDLDLVVVTRAEPDVAADAIVVITGLSLDDDVIWAADIRSAAEAVESSP
jgi:hypothetical protein